MLDKTQTAVELNRPSVAVAAFQTAIQRQDEFEKASEELRESQEKAKAERELKASQEDELAKNSDHSVDVFVNDSGGSNLGSNSDQRGNTVDVTA